MRRDRRSTCRCRDGGHASQAGSVWFCAARRGGVVLCAGWIPTGIGLFCWPKRWCYGKGTSLDTPRKDNTMDDTPRDPAVWKREQSSQWSHVAQGWQRRWVAFERGAQPLSDRIMELAHIAPGHKVLDVATGIGEPAMTAARKVGPSGRVVAIDQAPQMLEVARERMQAAGIETVEFVEGDAEAVTLPPGSFDAVVCRWGLMFFHDPVGTLTRLRNSLVPGGWLAVAVWGDPSQVPIISLPFSVFSRELSQPPSPPSGPNPFALSEPTSL